VLVSLATLALFPFAYVFPLLLILVVAMAMANNFWHPAAISFLSLRYPRERGYALSIHALGANGGDAAAPVIVGTMLLTMSWQTGAAVSALPVIIVAAIVAWLAWRERNNAKRGVAKPASDGLAIADYLKEVGKALKDRAVLTLALMAGLRTMTQNGLMAFLPLYLIDDLQVGVVFAGLILSTMQGLGMASAPLGGIISDRKGRKPVVLIFLSLAAIATFALTFLTTGMSFLIGAGALGFAIFAVRPVIHSWMLDITPPQLGASATSLLFGVQSGLSVLAPTVAGIIADRYGLGATLYLFAAFCAAAVITTIVIPARKLTT
jgi:MFS family permease